ncbi:hypothetical protein [uncultured Cetobacterium sp.]|uniref:hypothetical protein n=1 Tax=uncultured Cetobacterium sp. TaxID=527638 RepID=UPI002634B5D9|nr:hypothetical protein [uncultured Cetobacterium sp.]
MKKFILVSMMAIGLGTTAMARGNGNHQNNGSMMHNGNKMMMNCQTSEDKMMMMEQMKNNPKLKAGRIKLQENKLSMLKETSKDKPDFSTIEKLNKEKGNIQAEMKTEKMKMRYEMLKTNEKTN